MAIFSDNSKSRWILFTCILLIIFTSCRSIRMYGPQPSYLSREKFIGHFPPVLAETSGLQVYGDSLITFNDSGGKSGIYIFSPETPQKPIFLPLPGTLNVDWEDIAADSLYFYIGDIGNNYGSRDTLIIYKISISGLQARKVEPEIISFTFSEMTPAHMNKAKNPFDCEAMVVIKDSIWLFTKNWQDESSWIYKLPKTPGHYNVQVQSALFPGMLVTGADFSGQKNLLLIIGYHHFRPRILGYTLDNNQLRDYFFIRYSNLPGVQTEGIAVRNGRVFFSNERSLKKQGIYSFEFDESP